MESSLNISSAVEAMQKACSNSKDFTEAEVPYLLSGSNKVLLLLSVVPWDVFQCLPWFAGLTQAQEFLLSDIRSDFGWCYVEQSSVILVGPFQVRIVHDSTNCPSVCRESWTAQAEAMQANHLSSSAFTFYLCCMYTAIRGVVGRVRGHWIRGGVRRC